MITCLTGGQWIDGDGIQPTRERWLLVDGRIATELPASRRIDAQYRLDGCVVMPGGIDLHTHIGGGKVNIARLMLPERPTQRDIRELRDRKPWLEPLSCPVPNTWETGQRYLQMGYTACFEPAMLAANARQSHAEMRDTPWLDTGGYVLLGNDRMLLERIAKQASPEEIQSYVGWMIAAHGACAVKVVNAGGIDAFKFNQRSMDLDEKHMHYGITPRQILQSLIGAVEGLGLAHPLHVHCSNLGMAGNIDTTLATLDAAEGRRLHLTHAQYHCYGSDGPHGFSSAAARLADRINASDRWTIDVGQVLFGQTVTLSADTMHQYANRRFASPRKTIFQDLECQAGCGVLPFRYRESQYVHGLQWTIGLELFLRIEDSMKVFLTTDHPNGGPFTGYPHLIRLLMDYDFRMSIFERLHPDVRATSSLPSLKREYSWEEIAAITRTGPARALGLTDRGTLEPGAIADLVVYPADRNAERMFAEPKMVFRRGELVWREGVFVGDCGKTTVLAAMRDRDEIVRWGQRAAFQNAWKECYGYSTRVPSVSSDELCGEGHSVEWNRGLGKC
ncbi:MAG: formylmethanofuran dehydrogenase subunit A [Pirellula sp.]